MVWSSQAVIAQLVIIEGPNDGLFVYNGTPAAGNLVASIASQSGTDEFGNAYISGVATYSELTPTQWFAQDLTGDSLTYWFATGPGGPWTLMWSAAPGFLTFAGQQGPFLQLGGGGQCVEIGNIFYLSPSGDTSGATDLANLNAISALSVPAIVLMPGTFYLNGKFTVSGQSLSGFDMQTIVQPNTTGPAYTGALLAAGNKGTIRNLAVQSSGGDAITIAGGVDDWWLLDLFFSSNTGLCIHATPNATTHGRIRGIRGVGGGTANGGGISIDGGTGAAVTAEINISDINIQNCVTNEVLFLSSVTDVLVSNINGGIKAVASGGTAPAGITIQGACQTCHLSGVDVGGNNSSPAAQFIAAGANSPTDCHITGKLQQGAQGLLVNNATARCRFTVDCTRNQGDGAQFNGTGALNKLLFMGNNNNQAAGTAYDINVTSTVHLFVDAPQCTGGAVTANCNITLVGNHVSVVNPPAGFTFAGNAQAGW